MNRREIRKRLLIAKMKGLINIKDLQKVVIDFQWEEFFHAIQVMCYYYNGLIPKGEYEDFRMGRVNYPKMERREKDDLKKEGDANPPPLTK